RLASGTLIVEEPTFDPISGRVNTTWYWSGRGTGSQVRFTPAVHRHGTGSAFAVRRLALSIRAPRLLSRTIQGRRTRSRRPYRSPHRTRVSGPRPPLNIP